MRAFLRLVVPDFGDANPSNPVWSATVLSLHYSDKQNTTEVVNPDDFWLLVWNAAKGVCASIRTRPKAERASVRIEKAEKFSQLVRGAYPATTGAEGPADDTTSGSPPEAPGSPPEAPGSPLIVFDPDHDPWADTEGTGGLPVTATWRISTDLRLDVQYCCGQVAAACHCRTVLPEARPRKTLKR